jgi:hypothetical protein
MCVSQGIVFAGTLSLTVRLLYWGGSTAVTCNHSEPLLFCFSLGGLGFIVMGDNERSLDQTLIHGSLLVREHDRNPLMREDSGHDVVVRHFVVNERKRTELDNHNGEVRRDVHRAPHVRVSLETTVNGRHGTREELANHEEKEDAHFHFLSDWWITDWIWE